MPAPSPTPHADPGRDPERPAPAPARVHGPSLATGVGLMVLLTLYPPLLTRADGRADHGLALLMLWAMSAGLVRGVGFIPRWALWRWLFSGWACLAALALAAAYKFAPLF